MSIFYLLYFVVGLISLYFAAKHLEKIGFCLPGQIKLRIDLDSFIISLYGFIPFLLSGKSFPFLQQAICFTRHLVGRPTRENL